MTNDHSKLIEFLLTREFVAETDESYPGYGDPLLKMASKQICIQLVNDMSSVEWLEICSIKDRNSSYDMDRLRTLILKEDWLGGPRAIDAEIDFIENHFEEILEVFKEENYPKTKARLEELGNKRLRRIFPNWKNGS